MRTAGARHDRDDDVVHFSNGALCYVSFLLKPRAAFSLSVAHLRSRPIAQAQNANLAAVDLPLELLGRIFDRLCVQDRACALATCRTFAAAQVSPSHFVVRDLGALQRVLDAQGLAVESVEVPYASGINATLWLNDRPFPLVAANAHGGFNVTSAKACAIQQAILARRERIAPIFVLRRFVANAVDITDVCTRGRAFAARPSKKFMLTLRFADPVN